MHLPPLIQDLSIILIVAGAMTLLFRAIRQPVVLGYIVAGFLVGPHFRWLPTVLDTESVRVWAEIGVIFLLFALGLEFSFKKLMAVGAPASITAMVEVVGMVCIGFLIGKAFDWSSIDSLFLGGILAISSTTIIIRAFEELEMKTRGFVSLVFGVLIVEDLFAILLMVLLATVAVSQTFSGAEMGISVLKLGFFLVLWFILGIFLVPSFLKETQKFLKPETLLIVSVGLCFLLVVLATKVGFSPALGAFIMGSILAETSYREKIEHLIHPVKDLFGAIFFVSVGMLIDPQILVQYALPIAVITTATVVGKFLTTAVGALAAGQSLRHSVQAGLSLAQIGEFSFIIAGLGLSLKVTSDFLYPIAISVSAITTFTTPYLIRSSDSVLQWIEKNVSPSTLSALQKFRVESAGVVQASEWRDFIKRSFIQVLVSSVLVVAIFLTVSEFIQPWLEGQIENSLSSSWIALALAFLVSAPFLWALVALRKVTDPKSGVAQDRRFVGPLIALQLFRWFLALIICAILASRIVSPGVIFLLGSLTIITGIYIFSRYFESIYLNFERRFISNLQEKDVKPESRNALPLAPWDSHLAEIVVQQNSSLVGRKLGELAVREKFGVSIALIQRGLKVIVAPGRDEILLPLDSLQVIGTDDQIKFFSKECEAFEQSVDTAQMKASYVLKSIFIDASMPFVNKSIRSSGIREATQGLVVGIEKKGQRTLNPDSSILIEGGDLLWVVGDQEKFSVFFSANGTGSGAGGVARGSV